MTGTDQAGQTSRSGSPVRLVAGVVGIVVVAFIVLLATRDVQTNDPSDDIVGQGAPPIEGTSYDGTSFDLEEVLAENRVSEVSDQEWVVVNFFASWCVPCRIEHPELVRFAAEGTSCPTRLVGVTFNDTPENVSEFFDELGGDWPVLVGDTASMAIDYSVLTAPETFVIAPSGIVTAKFFGAVEYEQLAEQISC
ncbi:MAG: TlpA family protein disulfide reductase [Acidimicrobiales bacterium]